MALQIEATYENGVLKPDQPLPFAEYERVTVQVEVKRACIWTRPDALKWTGDPEVLRMIAEDPEFGVSESR